MSFPFARVAVGSRNPVKLAAVRATHPAADFQTIYAKAKAESPDLFR